MSMNSQISRWVTLSRTGEAARDRLDTGQGLPGDEDRVREAALAEKKLVKAGISLVGARRGTIHPARGNHRRRSGRRFEGAAA